MRMRDAICIAFMVAVATLAAETEFCHFTGRLSAEFETGYLSTSGTLCEIGRAHV